MAKTSVRLEPVGKADIAGRGRHNSRTGYIPENVDPSRTAFNVPLIGDDACEAIWQDIAGLDQARAGRREIVCAEVVSSFPTELLGNVSSGAKGAIECLESPIFQTWIDTTLEVMRKHGAFHAVLHMDETTPHIHAFLSIKTERKGAKRDRSGKSKFVLNYAAHWGMKGDKKTKDFYFAAGKVSHKPERLAEVEKLYNMKYDPAITPLGKLQTEFAEAYQSAGLNMERGESVLTTQERHKSFHEKEADDKRKAIEAEIDRENQEKLEQYRKQSQNDFNDAKADVDAEIDAQIEAYKQRTKEKLQAAINAENEAEQRKQSAEKSLKEARQAQIEAQQKAKQVVEQSKADLDTVKAHFKALKEAGSALFGLNSQAKGMVAYLNDMRFASDEKYKSAIWNGAQELRAAIKNTAETVERLAANDDGFPSAATHLGI